MADIRATKERARRALHLRMRIAARCYLTGPGGPSELVYCRVHTENKALGELAGTSLGYAESADVTPRLVFWREDGHVPQRNAVYSIAADEAYRVDHVESPDFVSIAAAAHRLSARDAQDFAPPGEA